MDKRPTSRSRAAVPQRQMRSDVVVPPRRQAARPQPVLVEPKPQPLDKLNKPSARSQRVVRRLGISARRAQLLERAVSRQKTKSKPLLPSKFSFNRRTVAAALATVIVGLTGYVSIDTWLTNQQVKAGYVTPAESDVIDRLDQEGRDEKEVKPDAIASYTVAADLPRVLQIPKINIKARVLPMGVNTDGSMQAPINIYDAGWYSGSVKPGQTGAVVVDAHASGPTRQGLFGNLDKLTEGDEVKIEVGDGTVYVYQVVATETVALDRIDMQKLLLPHGSTLEGLNMITCTGNWLASDQTYDQRHIVYTKRLK